jgi:hypothetical protein
VAAYYLITLIAVAVAWLKGGHPERLGATVILILFAASFVLHPIRMWNVHLGDAAMDLTMMLIFAWMALTRNRWWPLAMTAVMALTVMVHVAMFLVPTLTEYADISARVGLGILMSLTLLIGTGERWLSGERAVSGTARWRATSRSPAPRNGLT